VPFTLKNVLCIARMPSVTDSPRRQPEQVKQLLAALHTLHNSALAELMVIFDMVAHVGQCAGMATQRSCSKRKGDQANGTPVLNEPSPESLPKGRPPAATEEGQYTATAPTPPPASKAANKPSTKAVQDADATDESAEEAQARREANIKAMLSNNVAVERTAVMPRFLKVRH
jgi:hypothetical protein